MKKNNIFILAIIVIATLFLPLIQLNARGGGRGGGGHRSSGGRHGGGHRGGHGGHRGRGRYGHGGLREGAVRRAKLYYMRARIGKQARVQEKPRTQIQKVKLAARLASAKQVASIEAAPVESVATEQVENS